MSSEKSLQCGRKGAIVCGILCEVTTVCGRKDGAVCGMRSGSVGFEDGEGICGGLACLG